MLESVSYRAVLERGFALVKGADGSVRRRAASIKTGEALRLSFTDGEAEAIAGQNAKSKVSRDRVSRGSSKGSQGDLF